MLEIVKDTTEYDAASTAQFHLLLATVVILLIGAVLALLLGRGISRPLTGTTTVMNRLSSGDTSVAIPGGDRKDEVGTMARAVDVFRRNMAELRWPRPNKPATTQAKPSSHEGKMRSNRGCRPTARFMAR